MLKIITYNLCLYNNDKQMIFVLIYRDKPSSDPSSNGKSDSSALGINCSDNLMQRPKMPPPIFGRCGFPADQKRAADGSLGIKGKVCALNKAASPFSSQTLRQAQGAAFSIILPNTFHGSKRHF